MSPQINAGQDAAVAVLQSQQSSLESAVRDLAKTVSEGFAATNAKMDRVNELATTIAQMSAHAEAHSDGIRRAFVEIEDQGETLLRITGDHAAYVEEHSEKHVELDKTLATARGIVIGLTVAFSAIVSLLVYGASTYIGDTKSNTERIHQIELDIARNHPGVPRT